MKLLYTQVRRLVLLFVIIIITSNLFGQTTYTWNLVGGGAWTTASNWTPARNTPAANDILVINNGGTKVINNIPTQTIGKLQVSGNTNISLQSGSANVVLTVSTAASDAITVASGSTLNLYGVFSGGNEYTMTLTTANTAGLEANINGTVRVTILAANRPGTYGVFTKGGSNATINFLSSSLYTHNVNGSLIPQSNWNATSTCNITGLTSTEPSNLNQSFGHFTYDCPDHATLINFNSQLSSIGGNFTVRYAGEEQGIRTLNGLALSSNTSFTLNIGGNFVIDHYSSEATWLMLTTGTANVTVNVGGNFNMSNTGVTGSCYFDFKQNLATTMGVLVMNIAGNFNQTGGYFDWTFETNGGSNNTSIYLNGNFSFTNTSIMITSTGTATIPNGRLYFNKTGTQTVTVSNPANLVFTNFEVLSGSTVELLSNLNLQSSTNAPRGGEFYVNSGAILDANTFQINSSSGTTPGSNNEFILNSGAGIITANINGVHQIGFVGPTISAAIATRVFSSSANYTYDGAVTQSSGTFVTTPTANQVNNLTINNTAGKFTTGVTLQQPIAVAGVCTFTAGALTTTAVNLLTINDNATAVGANNNVLPSFANGPVKKIGNDAFTFPVGKVMGISYAEYKLCAISAPALATDAFTAEFMRASATLLGPITDPLIYAVSGCEYWKIDQTTGTSNVDVTLSWSGISNCSAGAYVTNLASLAIAHFGTSWDSHGANSFTGNVAAGTITWNGVTTFSPFSLTTTSPIENPLPIKFTSVHAYKIQNGNKVEWTNMTEQAVLGYELEKSAGGRTFTTAYAQQARMNNGGKADYNWIDANPFTTITYYRIKATDRAGAVTYSPIVKVQTGGSFQEGLIVYPNPVITKQFTVQLSGAAGLYKIKLVNSSGQQVMQTQWQHAGGMANRSVELPPAVSTGIYYLQVTGNNQTLQTKIAIQ